MFTSLYTSLTGLLGFSKGLNVISNNVANLNTPGFKSSQLSFEDLFYQYRNFGDGSDGHSQATQMGAGVNTGTTSIRFAAGDLRNTGGDTDVAISGNGFFVLHDADNNTIYSRDGQFQFNGDGVLVQNGTNYHVQALGGGGTLQDVNIGAYRISAPKATAQIKFSDNLSTGDTSHQVTGITVYDANGISHTWTATFTNNTSTTAGSWLVEVKDENGAVIANGEIRFQGNGSPQIGYNTITFNYSPTGAATTPVTLDFGTPGGFSGATSFSGGTTSTIKVASQDGYAAGSLTKATFDTNGNVTLTYSNGQTAQHQRLALAWFDDLQDLQQSGNNGFSNPTNLPVHLAYAGTDVMGTLQPGNIELSNVQLTQEFTDMIIVQRGYQGASQVISVTNEMIQQLFDMRSKQG